MATATPSPTPNPDALKYTLDVTLPESIRFDDAGSAADHPFARDIFQEPGVASVFGVNDFVTVTRRPGSDWDPITEAVQRAAAEHL